MSKYVIEFDKEQLLEYDKDTDTYFRTLYKAKGFNALVFDKNGLDKLTPLDKELEEAYQKGIHDGSLDVKERVEGAYQKGLEEGKARNEYGCVGCRYDDGMTDHSPCDYCCNAYSNQWSAKPCSDEIKVGDEVIPIDAIRRPFVVVSTDNNVIQGFDLTDGYTPRGCERDETLWKKTGRHFPQIAELLKAMKEGAE